MFNQEDLGRKIIIKDPIGHSRIEVGNEYIITTVHNGDAVRLNDTYDWICPKHKTAYVFTQDKFDLLEAGDEVLLLRGTTTMKKGSRLKIKEFLDVKNKRIVTDGILPGGWISSDNVVKLIDPKKYRIKNLQEIIVDFGMNFYNSLGTTKFMFLAMGRPLSDFKIEQTERWYLKLDEKYSFTNDMITEIENKPLEHKLIIVDKDSLESKGISKKTAAEIAGMDLVELFGKKYGATYETPSTFHSLFATIARNGCLHTDSGFTIQPDCFKLDVDIEMKKVKTDYILPF